MNDDSIGNIVSFLMRLGTSSSFNHLEIQRPKVFSFHVTLKRKLSPVGIFVPSVVFLFDIKVFLQENLLYYWVLVDAYFLFLYLFDVSSCVESVCVWKFFSTLSMSLCSWRSESQEVKIARRIQETVYKLFSRHHERKVCSEFLWKNMFEDEQLIDNSSEQNQWLLKGKTSH